MMLVAASGLGCMACVDDHGRRALDDDGHWVRRHVYGCRPGCGHGHHDAIMVAVVLAIGVTGWAAAALHGHLSSLDTGRWRRTRSRSCAWTCQGRSARCIWATPTRHAQPW